MLNGAGGFLGNDQILIAAAMRSLVAAARWPCGCAHREYVVERKGVRGGERERIRKTRNCQFTIPVSTAKRAIVSVPAE